MKLILLILVSLQAFAICGIYGEDNAKHPKDLQVKSKTPGQSRNEHAGNHPVEIKHSSHDAHKGAESRHAQSHKDVKDRHKNTQAKSKHGNKETRSKGAQQRSRGYYPQSIFRGYMDGCRLICRRNDGYGRPSVEEWLIIPSERNNYNIPEEYQRLSYEGRDVYNDGFEDDTDCDDCEDGSTSPFLPRFLDVANNVIQVLSRRSAQQGQNASAVSLNNSSLEGSGSGTGGSAISDGTIGNGSLRIGPIATGGSGKGVGGDSFLSIGSKESERSKHHETKNKGSAKQRSGHAKEKNNAH